MLSKMVGVASIVVVLVGYGLQYAAHASDRAVMVAQNETTHRLQKILDEEQDKKILEVKDLVLAWSGKLDALLDGLDKQSTEKSARMKSLRGLCRLEKLPADGPDCKEVAQWESNQDEP